MFFLYNLNMTYFPYLHEIYFNYDKYNIKHNFATFFFVLWLHLHNRLQINTKKNMNRKPTTKKLHHPNFLGKTKIEFPNTFPTHLITSYLHELKTFFFLFLTFFFYCWFSAVCLGQKIIIRLTKQRTVGKKKNDLPIFITSN